MIESGVDLDRVRRASSWVSRQWQRHSEWQAAEFLSAETDAHALRADLAGLADASTDAEVLQRLRVVRVRESVRIAARDLGGIAPFEQTCHALSDLAEALCGASLSRAMATVTGRHGEPRDASGRPVAPTILGMGKLGGRELNFSSDIDLIFCYAAPGESTTGQANEQVFERVVREFTRLLTDATADGFVYRVDWMLRPFGRSGPPAIHFDAIEDYYQVHGREWERYALIKARPVAGDLPAGRALLRRLQPFIYRRYFDFNAVGALRLLKRKIDQEVARHDLQDNIKLGAGGIREVEFIAQVFQLIRGGPESALRETRLRPVLRRLANAGHLSASTVRELDDAYVFLRRMENALQMQDDQQVHALPDDAVSQAELCAALGFREWLDLTAELASVRALVHREFERLFNEPDDAVPAGTLAELVGAVWDGAQSPKSVAPTLAEQGFGDAAPAIAEAVRSLRRSPLTRTLAESTVARMETLVVRLLEAACTVERPGDAAQRMLHVLDAVAGRSTYLTLLAESAVARAQLLRLCAASRWIADFIARSPVLLDQLLDVRTLYALPDRDAMAAELDQWLAPIPENGVEQGMATLRRFQQELTLRVAAADIAQALPLVQVSDRLTWLAEVLVDRVIARVKAILAEEHGTPKRNDGSPVQFAVVGYGKCGSLEMGYGSDLDLIFLHDCDAPEAETEGGERPLPAELWLARLAQRVIHWLSTRTGEGRIYEVDLELRPSGRRGLTVSSLAAFEGYQHEQAWIWEHQALTRARPVAGPAALRESIARVRRDVLCRPRDADTLRREVLDMRERMRSHQDRSRSGQWDVKQGEGGLTDLEFITQFLLLRDAHAHPDLVEWPDIWRQLEALAAAGRLPANEADALLNAQRRYREYLHRCSLDDRPPLAEAAEFTDARSAVSASWRRYLADEPASTSP